MQTWDAGDAHKAQHHLTVSHFVQGRKSPSRRRQEEMDAVRKIQARQEGRFWQLLRQEIRAALGGLF